MGENVPATPAPDMRGFEGREEFVPIIPFIMGIRGIMPLAPVIEFRKNMCSETHSVAHYQPAAFAERF